MSLKMGLAPHVNHGEEGCMCASTLASFFVGRQWEESQGQNRTREIRPSGIVGGLTETWGMVSAKRARTAERPKQPSTHLNRRAPCFYPDHHQVFKDLLAEISRSYRLESAWRSLAPRGMACAWLTSRLR